MHIENVNFILNGSLYTRPYSTITVQHIGGKPGGNQKSQTELLSKEVHFTHEYLMKVPMNELDMPIMMSHFF